MMNPWGLRGVQEQEAGVSTLTAEVPMAHCLAGTLLLAIITCNTGSHAASRLMLIMAERSSLTSLTTLGSRWLGQAWKEVGSCLWLLQGQGEVSTGWCYQCALLVSASHRAWLWEITFLALSWLSVLPNLQVSNFWSLSVSSQRWEPLSSLNTSILLKE